MRKFIATTVFLAILVPVSPHAFANSKSNLALKVANTNPQQMQHTWLGVSLAPVPMVLSKQLGNLLPDNQGVVVQTVVADSPAAKAGIQVYDILLSFNDQRLYSPQQLTGLVTTNKAGSEVTLSVIRNASKQDIKVTLENRVNSRNPYNNNRFRHPMFGPNGQTFMPPAFSNFSTFSDFWSQPFGNPNFGGSLFSRPAFPQGVNPSNPMAQANVMQQFESINIRSMDGDRFHAEVEYQENGGEKKKFIFEGKYDEIRAQIETNKELPESKKIGLLNALKNNPNQLLPNDFMTFPQFPAFPAMPQFNNNLNRDFNQPPAWFNNGSKI